MAELKIATYNIHRCVGTDGRCDIQRVAEVIRELKADVVGLQEVSNGDDNEPSLRQLQLLAEATGMTAVPGMRLIQHLGHYGNALLTRLPVISAQRHDISYSRFEPRGVLEVELEAEGHRARAIVTHLGLFPGERRAQVRKILSLAALAPADQTVILLGDINEWWPRGRPLRWLHAHFGTPPAPRSFPARWPLFSLDRIWVHPRAALHGMAAHVSPAARVASDHLPVRATLTV